MLSESEETTTKLNGKGQTAIYEMYKYLRGGYEPPGLSLPEARAGVRSLSLVAICSHQKNDIDSLDADLSLD